ncbi:MAG: ubiquinol-cytochrome c reductase iron-sulfur subunit [Anaerolineaceae bacterium]|nr:MAG: ubiquinol-cytochrome c reductase iron-sulfur subunit [Anaerolineaceae bacterium]
MTDLSRRDFLKLARAGFLWISSGLALGGLFRFLDYEPNPAPKTEFDLGPTGQFPLGSHTVLFDPPAILFHTKSGFSALSLTCTHLGCTLEQTADGFTCPCHASHFDADGNVTHGPASQSLRKLQVQITAENHVIVYLD